jgi:hypothetical protein
MANKSKPFSRTEMKILVFNKMKKKGMNYDSAYKELSEEIEYFNNENKKNEKKRSEEKLEKNKKKDKNKKFKEEFNKLCKGEI